MTSRGEMKILTKLFSLIAVLLMLAGPELAQAQSISVDYGTTTGVLNTDVFGGNALGGWGSGLAPLGFTLGRVEYRMNRVLPAGISLSSYQSCVGTNNGVCNPA